MSESERPVDEPGAPEALSGREGAGDSGGGAYPNPHTAKESGDKDGFFGRGGQTGMAYHGHGSLGGEKVDENANAPAGGGESDSEEE